MSSSLESGPPRTVGARLAETLAAWLVGERSGAVEWRDERRRRLYFFDAGTLSLTQSNLKSESVQRLGELHPGLDEAQLDELATRKRVAGGLVETQGEILEHAGVPAPDRSPSDLLAILWEHADLLPRPLGFPRTHPGGVRWISRLPISESLQELLADLDGERPVPEVAAFAPAEPQIAENALALAALVGAVDLAPAPTDSRVITPRGGPPPPPVAHEAVLAPKPTVDSGLAAAAARIRAAQNHYEVLGAAPDAPADALRRAYLALARDLHPDKWSSASAADRATAEDVFERVRAAWETLGEEGARKAYTDRVIHGVKSEEELAQERVRLIMEAEVEFKRGLAEYQAGRMLPANELFLRAAQKVPEDQEIRAYAGYTTYRVHAGRNEEKAAAGAAEVADAIRQNERLDQGYVLQGLIQWAKGQEAEAKASFVQALRIRPANPDALRELKRLQRTMDPEPTGAQDKPAGGFFSRLFGKK